MVKFVPKIIYSLICLHQSFCILRLIFYLVKKGTSPLATAVLTSVVSVSFSQRSGVCEDESVSSVGRTLDPSDASGSVRSESV